MSVDLLISLLDDEILPNMVSNDMNRFFIDL